MAKCSPFLNLKRNRNSPHSQDSRRHAFWIGISLAWMHSLRLPLTAFAALLHSSYGISAPLRFGSCPSTYSRVSNSTDTGSRSGSWALPGIQGKTALAGIRGDVPMPPLLQSAPPFRSSLDTTWSWGRGHCVQSTGTEKTGRSGFLCWIVLQKGHPGPNLEI